MKWLGATGAVMAIGAAGFLAAPSSANGAVPPVVATHGSITCSIAGKAALSPPLVDDWLSADHASDSSTAVQTFKDAVASIPEHTYSSVGPVSTSAKIASLPGTCSGTANDGTTTVHVASAKMTALSVSGDSATLATCAGLATAATGTGEDGPQTFDSIIAWTTNTGEAKLAPTTIHATLNSTSVGGTGFTLKAGTSNGGLATDVTGSFAGGNSAANAYIDATSLTALTIATLGIHPNFATPDLSDVCEAPMAIKSAVASDPGTGGLTSDAIAIKVKKPKGLKAIVVGNTALQGCTSSCTDSTISVSHS